MFGFEKALSTELVKKTTHGPWPGHRPPMSQQGQLVGWKEGRQLLGGPVSVGHGYLPVWLRACMNVGDCEAAVR